MKIPTPDELRKIKQAKLEARLHRQTQTRLESFARSILAAFDLADHTDEQLQSIVKDIHSAPNDQLVWTWVEGQYDLVYDKCDVLHLSVNGHLTDVSDTENWVKALGQ